MGYLDFTHDKEHLGRIKRALARRGMEIDADSEWEIHGPHQGMNYQVCVGYAYVEANPKAACICSSKDLQKMECEAHRRYYCVAIYPRAVYEVGDKSEWWNARPENKILTKG